MAALEAKLPETYWVEINRAAGPLRQARLHGDAPEVLHLPGARHVPAGGGDGAPVRR